VQAVVTEAEAEGEEEEEETKEVEEAVVKMKMEVEKISVPKSIRGIVRWSLCPRSLCVCVCVCLQINYHNTCKQKDRVTNSAFPYHHAAGAAVCTSKTSPSTSFLASSLAPRSSASSLDQGM
jgi:hypothetical protein